MIKQRVKKCLICNEEFIPNSGNQLYCDVDCYLLARKKSLTKLDKCCIKHGGIDNCPFEDCICE